MTARFQFCAKKCARGKPHAVVVHLGPFFLLGCIKVFCLASSHQLHRDDDRKQRLLLLGFLAASFFKSLLQLLFEGCIEAGSLITSHDEDTQIGGGGQFYCRRILSNCQKRQKRVVKNGQA